DANFDGYDQGYNPTDPNNPSIIVGDLSKTIGTRAITEVTYDSSVEGMTMHEYATLGLKLSNTMKDVVAPMGLAYIWGLGDYGLIGGNLILNSDDIDASFRQSDGAGGSMNMTLIEDGWARVGYAGVYFTHATGIMSTLEDANYGAPLDLVGTIILGDPEGAGEDFEISGLIVDGYSPIEDMLWDYYGELMPGKLIKVGDEAVTLSRANTFTGGVDANEGTLVMADTLALGDITGPGLRLQGGTLRIAVADANFDAAAGGYAFSMTDDSTVEVNAAGANLKAVDLDNGTLVINNQMVGATAPSAGPGAGARTVINVPDVSIDYVVGLQGTLDVPASATIHNIEDFGASDANTLFQIGAGQTLTIDGDETLDDNRIWNVVGGATLLYSGDLTTAFTLRKAGAGTFTLAGANNSIASLVIGTSPGGTVIVTAAGKVPDSVLIEAGSLYTVQKGDHDYDEVAAASAGIAALSSGSNANVNFSDNTAYLGAVADSTYSGDLTPSAAGYFLGGGGARLTVDDLLTNAAGPNTPATLGWADSHDNNVLFTEGVVLLNAENTLTGDVQVHMETIYLQKAFELVEPTDGNWIYVNPGGTLDLNNTGAREDNIMMNGGGLANTGGTLDANKMFPGPTGDYIIGSNSAGKTSWVDGGFVRANASLWKIGSDTA
ncbi:MAG: autotransporter-associated beta strand repeat-containing protein, partial [Phycisphaerae bacterium]